MALEKYRKTMTEDVLHSWAGDAQNKIDSLSTVLSELKDTLEPAYKASPEGRQYLKKIEDALNQ